ncbi:hypothetical protein [Variovorax paradoxus]|uniref:hypothetical protein n=1 Tax=Variovorax paradoxus TaxID=34073 RepID=UPI003D650820
MNGPNYAFPLVPAPADQPTLVGTVNADDHRPGLLPRSLEDAFGPGQRSSSVRLHIAVPRRQQVEEAVVIAASALAGLFVIALLFYERIAS